MGRGGGTATCLLSLLPPLGSSMERKEHRGPFTATCFVCVEGKDERCLRSAGSGFRRFRSQLCYF